MSSKQKYKSLVYKDSSFEIDWFYTKGESSMGLRALAYGSSSDSQSWQQAYDAFTGQHLKAACNYNRIERTLRQVSIKNRTVLLAAFTPRQWKVSARGVEIQDYNLKNYMQLADSNISLVGVCFLSPLAERYYQDQHTKTLKNWVKRGSIGEEPKQESFLDFLVWSAALGRSIMLDRVRGNCSELLNKALAEYDGYRLQRIRDDKKCAKSNWGIDLEE